MSIKKNLLLSIRLLLDCDARNIIVAYSGGVDSHVLLHLVAELRQEFPQHQYSAKHIHHGLSERADQWAAHCKRVCTELGINFKTEKVDVDLNSNSGLEAAAREARYNGLMRDTLPNSAILLAQHADDQLETFLLQLKRGGGPKGLAAMPVISEQSNHISLIRPFLAMEKCTINRREIEHYASANSLVWVEDESNSNIRFDRNFLRQLVLPNLTQRWPELSSSVQRSARLCAQQQELLEEVAAEKLATVSERHDRLNIQTLLEYSRLWQAQILRYWLDTLEATMPSEAVLSEIQQVLLAREDANPIVEWHRWQIRRYRNNLYCLTDYVQEQRENIVLEVGENVQLTDSLGWVRVENLADSFPIASAQIRFGGYAVKFKPLGEKFSKPIKQWFQRWQIEPWNRQIIPLVFINNELVAILFENKTIFAERGSNFANESLHQSLKRGNTMPL